MSAVIANEPRKKTVMSVMKGGQLSHIQSENIITSDFCLISEERNIIFAFFLQEYKQEAEDQTVTPQFFF